MVKKSVREVAEELNLTIEQVMEKLKSLHIIADSPDFQLDDNEVIKIKAFIKVSLSTSGPLPVAEKPKAKTPVKVKADSRKEKPKKTEPRKQKAKAKDTKEATEKQKAKPLKKVSEKEKTAATAIDQKATTEGTKSGAHLLPADKGAEAADADKGGKPEGKKRIKYSAAGKKIKAIAPGEESFFSIEDEEHQDTETILNYQGSPTISEVIREQEQRPRMFKVKKIKRRRIMAPPPAPVKTASQRKKASSEPTADKEKIVSLSEAVTVKEFADKLGLRVKDVLKKFMDLGYFFNLNQVLNSDLAVRVAEDLGYMAEIVSFEEDLSIQEEEQHASELVSRAPVVTVMGHVDHGKTSLLDAIREAHVVDKEFGGITQHIGAYTVQVKDRTIVFLDTPGHEAFTKMRARGAQVTDIVILVVGADDGVKQQTIEAIDHARAAKVPILVAINKVDKPEANVDRVKQQLSELELVPEDWGGTTIMCPISAKKKTGIENLMDMLILLADMQELKADLKRRAQGYIIETKIDPGRGPVATVLVLDGILHIGDSFIAGNSIGRVRAMFSDKGQKLEEVRASAPVEVLGLEDLPKAGDKFQVVEGEVKARKIQSLRERKTREDAVVSGGRISLEELFDRIKQGEIKELNLIIKADVHGSAEVLNSSLSKLSHPEVNINVIRSGVGAISESDVLLAAASNAIIIGFNIRPRPEAVKLAAKENVDIRLHTIIYEVINEIKEALEHRLAPHLEEAFRGRAEVRETFHLPKGKTIAGSHVVEGIISRKDQARLLRDDVIIHTGKIASLRRFKDDVSEVKNGFECGIGLEDFNDLKVGDIVETFAVIKTSAKL
jgi:translation initiation factor IF-2